jgi:hypothetical protein
MHRLFLSHSIESSQHTEMLQHSSPCGSEQDLKVIPSAVCVVYLSVRQEPEIYQTSITFRHEYYAAVIRPGRVCEWQPCIIYSSCTVLLVCKGTDRLACMAFAFHFFLLVSDAMGGQ